MKRSIRTAALAGRRSADAGTRAAADAAIVTHLVDLVRRTRPATLAGYAAVPGEPGGPGLVEALAAALPPGGRLILPVVRPDLDLDWAGYDGTLVPARRGLREPAGPRLGTAAVGSADLVVVPALRVDRDGIRLGQGGGCYDRALPRVPAGVPVIALLYPDEIVDRLPAAPHDRPVGAVLDPDGLHAVGPGDRGATG